MRNKMLRERVRPCGPALASSCNKLPRLTVGWTLTQAHVAAKQVRQGDTV